MDAETARAIQGLLGMVDGVNSNTALNNLARSLAVALACSARRNGFLNEVEEDFIQQSFSNCAAQVDREPYEAAKSLFAASAEMWRASDPNTN